MNKRFCKYCGTPLRYKQKKFCSRHCQAVGYRLDWTEEKRTETNKNISKAAQKRCQNPEYLSKQSISQKKAYANSELRRMQSELGKRRFEDPIFKEKVVSNLNAKMKNICKTKEYRDKLSKKALEIGQKPEIKMVRSENSKIMWKNPEHAKKVFRRRNMSRPEEAFQKDYIERYNLPFYFNGTVSSEGRELTINRKIPDFVHNSEPKLIEIWGDYYHKGQNPQSRIDFFKKHGYDCIVIWASELKNQDFTTKKINSYLGI